MLVFRRFLAIAAAIAFVVGAGSPLRVVHAAGDDSGAFLWVPWVKTSASVVTQVVVINRGTDPIALRVHALGAPSSGGGQVTCKPPPAATPLDPHEQVTIDVARDCALPAAAFDGVLVFEGVTTKRRPARLRAVARWLVSNQAGTREQEVPVPVLPFGAMPGIETVQRIDDLAHDDVSALPVQTDCQISVLPAVDASPRRLELRLKRAGGPLGVPIPVAVDPGAVESVNDLFRKAGVAGGMFDAVQLNVEAPAQPDAGIAVICAVVRARAGAPTRPSPAVTIHAGLPLAGASLVRRHEASVSTSANGSPLVVRGTESAMHMIFLRHEDRISCSVRPTDSTIAADALRLAVVTPDKKRTLGGTDPDVTGKESGTRAGTADGLGGAWALFVEQAEPDPALGIAYRLSCETGNGVSPPLLAAVWPQPMPRP